MFFFNILVHIEFLLGRFFLLKQASMETFVGWLPEK